MQETYNFSDDFQDLIIACFIDHSAEFSSYGEIVKPSYFNGSAAYNVMYEINEFAKKYHKFPNWVTLGNYVYKRFITKNPDKAKESVEYVKKLAQLDTSDFEAVRDSVLEFAKERAIQSAFRVALDAKTKGEEVEGGIIKLFEDALAVGTNFDDIGLFMHKDIEKVKLKLSDKEYGIKTGFELLDKVWRRGWGPGWLVVPLAPPKRYKSTFCLNLALQMADIVRNADVFYYACEISQELAFMRGLLNISGKSEDEMYKEGDEFWVNAQTIVDTNLAGQVMFKGMPSKTATIHDIEMHARNVIKQTGIHPKAIIIDYAETVRPANEKLSDWRQQAEIYTQARAMGAKLGACIIMPDRCNAEAVDRKVPSMKSFQGAFEKAGIVDAAIGLCATESEHKQGVCRYFIFVNRHGPQYLHFRGKVDPTRYKMTIDEEIEYDPDKEEAEAEERRAARRGGGGGRTKKPTDLDAFEGEV